MSDDEFLAYADTDLIDLPAEELANERHAARARIEAANAAWLAEMRASCAHGEDRP